MVTIILCHLHSEGKRHGKDQTSFKMHVQSDQHQKTGRSGCGVGCSSTNKQHVGNTRNTGSCAMVAAILGILPQFRTLKRSPSGVVGGSC